MSQLQQYDEAVICPVQGGEHAIVPGGFVTHVEDLKAFGIVIAKVGGQVNVLWSKEPRTLPDIQVQQINAKPRALRAKWTAVEEDTKFVGDFSFLSRSPRTTFEGEETYHVDQWDERMNIEMEHERADITYNMEGTVTVRRKLDRLPDDVDPKDVSVRRSRW